MRVLIAHCFYRVEGGEDRYVRSQIELLKQDHTVGLLSEENASLDPDVRTAARMLYSRAKRNDVAATIRDFKPDVIHLHNAYPGFGPAVHLAASRTKVPLIQTVHNFRLRCPNGFMFTEGEVCRRCEGGFYLHGMVHHCFSDRKQAGAYTSALWAHRFLIGLERRVATFVAPSRFMAGLLRDWGVPREKVEIVPHFVEPGADVSARPGEQGAFVGRLSSEKGVDVLLQALQLAGDPPFVIVGDGPLDSELRILSERLDLRNVTFTGRLTGQEVVETMSKSRFVVVPSLSYESAGLVGLEGMALGRPLIVADHGGLSELASSGAGLVFSPGDPRDLAAQMLRLINDPTLCTNLGEAGLVLIRSAHDPGKHLKRLTTVYEDCVKTAI